MLLKAPNKTIIFASKKLNSNLNKNATAFIVINWPITPIHLKLTYVILFKLDDLELMLIPIN